MLVSAALHILAVLALNLLLAPGGGPHVPQERPYIHVSFSYSDQGDESLTDKAPPEMPGPGPMSDGLERDLAPAIEAHNAPERARVFEPSQIPQEELQIRARFSYILEAAQQQTTIQ
jgi:hypothetical protein